MLQHPASKEDRNKYIERYRYASPELEGLWKHASICPSRSQTRLSHSHNSERLQGHCLIGYSKAINYVNSSRPPSPSRRTQRASGVPRCSQGQAPEPHTKASGTARGWLFLLPQHPPSPAQHPQHPMSPAQLSSTPRARHSTHSTLQAWHGSPVHCEPGMAPRHGTHYAERQTGEGKTSKTQG